MLEAPTKVPVSSPSTPLPKKQVAPICFALTNGYDELATPFLPERLWGEDGLLGSARIQTKEAEDAFFLVPAPVYLCDEVTSTFAVAHALAQTGHLPIWGTVLAATQTAGKGQLGRRWQSPRGNLYATFRLPATPLFSKTTAALATGVLLAKAFSHLGYPLRLKWPNDLLNSHHAKAAGILLENRSGVLLAGVGVNLRVLPDSEQLRRDRAVPAGLLLDINDKPTMLPPFVIWQKLMGEMIKIHEQTLAFMAADALPAMAEPFLAWRGEAVGVSEADGTTLSGTLEGVGPAGGLFLLTPAGRTPELMRGSLARI